MNKKYIFNPAYLMINDKKRVIITESLYVSKDPLAKDGFTSIIHPVCAILVIMFDGKHTFEDTIEKASVNLGLDRTLISDVAKTLIENPEEVRIQFGETASSFPQRTLIEKKEADRLFGTYNNNYKIRDFFIPNNIVDLKTVRSYKPIEMSLIINLKCATDCIYCYANKKQKYVPLSTERILELVDEAKRLNMRNFDITGGELFLHKDWDIILERIIKNGFIPYISTKVPIDEKTIIRYKEVGMKKIQVSIDSFNSGTLVKLLQTNHDYVNKITKTFDLLEKHCIEVVSHTILTNYNASSQNIQQLITKLNPYSNISSIKFDFAGYSIYLNPTVNQKIMLSKKEAEHITENIRELRKSFPKVSVGSISTMEGSFRVAEEKFKKRARCTGNLYRFTMLPDGKVTYCEELYWQENLIIGDLSSQSIEEMWNGSAKEIFDRRQESFQNLSPCFSCEDFDNCQREPGVCWKDIIGCYGIDNWSYPDPRCPKALKPIFPYIRT
jgi:radical SAM protein with 4Fe4S-binding SPASM domain